MGNSIDDMQVGCVWVGDQMISVSLSGFINYLDPANPDKPKKIIKVCTKYLLIVCILVFLNTFFEF